MSHEGPRGSSAPCLSRLMASPSEEEGVREADPHPTGHRAGRKLSVGGLGTAAGWGPGALGSCQGGIPLHGERDPRGK